MLKRLAGPEEATTFRRSKRIALLGSLAGVGPKWGDSAGLTSLVVETIVGHRLRDDDVADFMRFRLVCKLWMDRSSTNQPRELGPLVIDHSYHPRQWILLTEATPEATPTRRKLLNVSSWKIIKVDLPELTGHIVVPGHATASEGMLVLRNDTTLVVRLLNPLTHHVVDFPSLQMLQPEGSRSSRWGPIPHTFRLSHEVTAAGFADASTVVYFGHITQMAMAKPRDALWTAVGGLNPKFSLMSTATSQGRFYCVDRTDLLVVDLEQRPHLQLVVAADMERQFLTVSFVDDGSRLTAVYNRRQLGRRVDGRRRVETQIELFHVDLEEEMLLPILDLGERAIFTGSQGAVLLPKTNYYFSVQRGTVHFRIIWSHGHFGAFHVHRRQMDYRASIGARLPKHVASYATAGME